MTRADAVVAGWVVELERVVERLGPRFARSVARQYCGALGKLANCQVGVFLLYASAKGAVFLDRALFLPAAWASDPQRRAAGVPTGVEPVTKPQLAGAMLERVLVAGVPAGWVTADETYGDDHRLRVLLEQRSLRYALAVSGKDTVSTVDWGQRRVGALVAALSEGGWQWLRLLDPPVAGWARWLLVRRSPDGPSERQAYVCVAPVGTTLAELVAIAGQRWTSEAACEAAKQEVGLGDYEVRSWQGWHRHVTLALFAHALLVALRAVGLDPVTAEGGRRQQATGSSMAAFRQHRAAQERSGRSPSPRSAVCSLA